MGNIPCSRFNVMEYGELSFEGVVIDSKDLKLANMNNLKESNRGTVSDTPLGQITHDSSDFERSLNEKGMNNKSSLSPQMNETLNELKLCLEKNNACIVRSASER